MYAIFYIKLILTLNILDLLDCSILFVPVIANKNYWKPFQSKYINIYLTNIFKYMRAENLKM